MTALNFTSNKLTGHNGSIYAFAHADSTHFYSAGGEGWIAEWPWKADGDGRLVAEIGAKIFSLCQIKVGKLLAAGTMQGNLYFIDLEFADQVRNIHFHEKGVFSLQVHNSQLLAAGGDGKLSIWDCDQLQLQESVILTHDRLRCMAISPDQQMLAVGSSDGNIYLLHCGSWKLLEVIRPAHDNSVFSLSFTRDGQYLLSGSRDAHLKMWSIYEGFSLVQDLPAHWFTINDLDVHPDGKLLATASRDKTIRIWDIATTSLIQTLDLQRSKGHLNSVNALMWSPQGDALVSGSDDRSIIVWTIVNTEDLKTDQ